LQEAIAKDIQDSMAPPKPQPQSAGSAVEPQKVIEVAFIDKKQA
jgi:hypothetical protein